MGRIVHISSEHNPFHFRVFHRELKALKKNGYNPIFITKKAPAEIIEGVEFRSLPELKFKFFRVFLSPVLVFFKILKIQDSKIVHIHSAELLSLSLLLKLFGKKIIYEAHDNLKYQIYTKDWIPNFIKPLISVSASLMERFFSRFADSIIVVEPTNAPRFSKSKRCIIRNYPLAKEFGGISASDYKSRENILVYFGHISEKRGILDYLTAIELIPDSFNAKLLLAGNIAPNSLLDKLKKRKGWEKVHYVPYLKREEIINSYAKSKIGLLVLEDNQKYMMSDPVKLFEYLAAGVPFVMSDFPNWKKILDGKKPYEVCSFGRPEELAGVIIKLLENADMSKRMGQDGRSLFEAKYIWETEEEKLLNIYKSLAF